VPDRVKPSFVIFDIRALIRTLSLSERPDECPDVKNYNGLTRCGTGCFLAVPIWQKWASKGWLNLTLIYPYKLQTIGTTAMSWECDWFFPIYKKINLWGH